MRPTSKFAAPPSLQSSDEAAALTSEPPIGQPLSSGLSIDVVEEAGDWATFGTMEALLAPLIAAVNGHPALQSHWPAEVCLALGDDQFVRNLNRDFRQVDKPTNVLSFPAPEIPVVMEGDACVRPMGDIVLALETVLREAREQELAPVDHVRHLVLHGLLHLAGYDHDTDVKAQVMEALEIEILGQIGIANPYTQELISATKVRL